MKNILRVAHLTIIGLLQAKRFIPAGFVVLITLTTTLIAAFKNGFQEGMTTLMRVLFAAELIIRQNTELAIAADPSYTFFAFMQIINGVLIMYFVTKFIGKYVLVKITGSQAEFMAYAVALLIVGIIEISAIRMIEGYFFIPIKDGLWFMIANLTPVLGNINWWSTAAPDIPLLDEVNKTNSTVFN